MFGLFMAAFTLGVAVAIPPGPVFITGSQKALTGGFWKAFQFYLGVLVADGVYALLVYLGFSTVFAESQFFRLALWLLGGAWLVYLGVEAIRARVDLTQVQSGVNSITWTSLFRAGLLITLFNPLTIVSWLALAGNFYTRWSVDWPPMEQTGLLAIVFMLAGIQAWTLGSAAFLSAIRRMIDGRILRWISVISGMVLIGYGISAWLSALEELI